MIHTQEQAFGGQATSKNIIVQARQVAFQAGDTLPNTKQRTIIVADVEKDKKLSKRKREKEQTGDKESYEVLRKATSQNGRTQACQVPIESC